MRSSENAIQEQYSAWMKIIPPEGLVSWPIKSPALSYSPGPRPLHRFPKLCSWTCATRIGLQLFCESSGRPWPRGAWMIGGGLFSDATYGDVGFLVTNPDPASTKKTFVRVGNISHVLGPLYAKILGEDEPFRRRRLTGHVFEGEFEELLISEVTADIVRFTFRNPSSITYHHKFSVHQKPKDDPNEKSARWRSIVTNVARFAEGSNIPPDTMVLITGHRTTAVISAKYGSPEAVPPPEVHFFLSYEDWTTSYWSYEDEYKPIGERDAIAEPTASLGASSQSERRGFYIQFIPEDFEDLPGEGEGEGEGEGGASSSRG